MKRPSLLFRRARRLRRDRSGVVGPAVAVMGTSLIAAGGLALDVGLFYMGNRELRSATEAAALAAAMNPAQAQARAIDYLAKNGYPASVLKQPVQVGYYCASVWRASGSRFTTSPAAYADCPGSTIQNAVRVTTGRPSRRFLTGILGGASPIPDLTATAAAARIDEAGIAVTSGHLTVTNTLLNSVNNLLGALIGIKLNLSTAQIEALMGGNVDAGRFLDVLAQRTGGSGTYHEVAQRTYGMGDIAQAAADAAYDPATAAALRAFGTAAGNGYRVPLAGMFGLGVWKNMPAGEHHAPPAPPALNAGLNAYQLLAYSAQAGPGTIDLSNAVNLLTSVTSGSAGSVVKLTAVASGAGGRPRFSFGPAGETQVGTSMLRLQLEANLVNLGIPGILNAEARVPLVLDVAAAEAEIVPAGINCTGQSEQRSQTTVTVHTKSGLVNGYIGDLLDQRKISAAMPTLTDADFAPANFFRLNVTLVSVGTLRGKVIVKPVVGENSAYPVFGPGGNGTIGGPQASGTGVVIGNASQVGATVTTLSNSLLASNSLQACLLSLACLRGPDPGEAANLRTVLNRVGGLLGNTADPLLDNVLAALGVQLGHATVWVNGARCGVPVLI